MYVIMRYIINILLISAVFCSHQESSEDDHTKEDTDFWYRNALSHLNKTLDIKNVEKKVKNVILFVGDGMGISTITAGRIYKGQSMGLSGEEYNLAIDEFPNSGLVKTYSVNSQVTDSAAAATALFCGVKIRFHMLGLDARAKYKKCDSRLNKISQLESIATWAQRSGKDTGFVTNARVTHATPAGLYAHANDRQWEGDIDIPKKYKHCIKDIARQLVEEEPGRNFKVIMGGGGKYMCPRTTKDKKNCSRKDGRNLMETWLKMNPQGKFVTTTKELMNVDTDNATELLGIFSRSHLDYQTEKDETTPSLVNMTEQAIRVLRKNPNGFFLMIESGRIDLAHHKNKARLAMDEFVDLDDAIKMALKLVDLEETLLIVTADHSHALTLNGYAKRGSNILGVTGDTKKAYETLSYANGPAFTYHRVESDDNVDDTWRPLNKNHHHRSDVNYKHFAGRLLPRGTHAGEDVGLYAIGPYSHLFRGVFEQNYIPHAIAYASCYKDRPSHCDNTV